MFCKVEEEIIGKEKKKVRGGEKKKKDGNQSKPGPDWSSQVKERLLTHKLQLDYSKPIVQSLGHHHLQPKSQHQF